MTFSFGTFRRVTVPAAVIGLSLALACGTDAASTFNVEVDLPTVPVSPVVPTVDPGEVEISVAESSFSVTVQRYGEGELFLSAPPDYYDAYDWDTAPGAERPEFLDGVVQHRTLSPDVGIRGLSNTAVALRGKQGNSHGFSSGLLWSSDPEATPVGSGVSFPLTSADEVSLDVGQDFVPHLFFETRSAFEGIMLVTAIVDYEQVEFEMDGVKGLLHEFKTLPGRRLAIPIDFGSFPAGAHDIALLVFPHPYSGYGYEPIEPALRTLDDYRVLDSHPDQRRVRLVVGGDETPARVLSVDSVGIAPPSENGSNGMTIFSRAGAAHYLGENRLTMAKVKLVASPRLRPGQATLRG